MNSSGIKRGLAVTAISALAVTGLPALAGSASAAPGDVIQVQSTTTTRNGGDQGALIVLNTKGVDPAQLDLAGTDLSATGEDNQTQAVDIIGPRTLIASGTAGDNTPNDGFDQITLRVKVTTPPGGDDVADFVIFEDEAGGTANTPDLDEPRTQTSVETTGEVTTIEVTPETQTSPSGQPSGAYTVTIRDAEGDLTQLTGSETVALTDNGDLTFGGDGDGDAIDASEINDGTGTFTATGTTVGSQTITATQNGKSDTAVLNVTKAATLDNGDIDVVTGADSSDGAPANDPTFVRVDQNSVRLDIDSDDAADANSTVTFTVTGTNVTFNGGKASTTVTTTLDENGVGSVTITPDAGSIQEGDSFAVDGSGIVDLDFEFQRSAVGAASVDAPALVYTQVDTPTSVTVTVTDQFGNPVEGAQVSADSNGNGVDNTQPRQSTNASGQTTFTFPAGDTQVGDEDIITYTVFDDAADNSGTVATEKTTVRYTADGMGPNYQIALDGQDTEGANYSPDDVTVIPLTDANANDGNTPKGDEVANLTITNGAGGTPVTVTVDNGALILTGGDTSLEDGTSSATGVVGDTFEIVGTTSGIVTVTTTSGGRTETAQFTVEAQDDGTTARNVSVSGPATVPFGTDNIEYIAVITDAFGNPVEGVSVGQLNIQVTGPGEFQDSEVATDENGQIRLNVNVDEGAEGVITIKVTGIGSQFGAEEDRLTAGANTDNAEGLPASSDVATASTTVEAEEVPPPPPVEPEKVNAALALKGKNNGKRDDNLFANAINKTRGATVTLFKRKNGDWKKVATGVMNNKGNYRFNGIKDRNGRKLTKYKAVVQATEKTRKGNGKKSVR